MANQDLFFDITKLGIEQEKQQYIVTRVGDGGLKAVTITVVSNGTPYNLTGLTPVFEGVKPDGTKIIDSSGFVVLDPRNGVFRYIFPQQASTAEGEYKQAFFKLKRGEQTDSTLEISVRVLKNRVEFGINSEDYITDYQRLVNDLEAEFKKGLDLLNATADATSTKVNSNAALVDSINLQLKAVQDTIKTNQLITKSDLDAQINPLKDQITSFVNSMETFKNSITDNVNQITSSKMNANVEPGVLADVSGITKSGTYYFNETTANLPVRNGGNSTGYIQAIMKDADNGMLTMLGSGYSIEKYKGQLYGRWKTSIPVKLWSGKALKGDTIALSGDCRQFQYLIVEISFVTNRYSVNYTEVPQNDGGTLYFNTIGMQTSGDGFKNGTLEEVALTVTNSKSILVKNTLKASGTDNAVDSDAYIGAIYGIY